MTPPDADGQFEAACAYWRSLRSDEGAVYDIDVQIAVFDSPEKTFRSELSADYKEHRKAMPPDLISQMDRIKEGCESLGVATATPRGVEA